LILDISHSSCSDPVDAVVVGFDICNWLLGLSAELWAISENLLVLGLSPVRELVVADLVSLSGVSVVLLDECLHSGPFILSEIELFSALVHLVVYGNVLNEFHVILIHVCGSHSSE
jgi:hypothetical protein